MGASYQNGKGRMERQHMQDHAGGVHFKLKTLSNFKLQAFSQRLSSCKAPPHQISLAKPGATRLELTYGHNQVNSTSQNEISTCNIMKYGLCIGKSCVKLAIEQPPSRSVVGFGCPNHLIGLVCPKHLIGFVCPKSHRSAFCMHSDASNDAPTS